MQYSQVLIFVFSYIFCVYESRSENALIFNLKTKKLEDVRHFKQAASSSSILTACTASTQEEKLFNEKISITQSSVFVRNIHREYANPKTIPIDICDEPPMPATVYNSKTDEYLIGYELYYDEEKIRMDDSEDYESLRPVNAAANDSLTRELERDALAIKYRSLRQTKFKITTGSLTLTFYWIPVLSIKSSSYNKRRICFKDTEVVTTDDHLNDKCEDYNITNETIDFLYSKENQMKILKHISAPSLSSTNDTEIPCGNPFGCLVKRQIIPLWYFNTSSAKLASCSGANSAPIWKTIADGQLTKVDQYIYALTRYVVKQLQGEAELFFGVSGVLKMNKTIDANKRQEREILLSDATDNQSMVVPVPKIIYRIIYCAVCVWEKAAIIIHNDPTVLDSERLCPVNSQLDGWEKITNTDRSTGLTYVCRVTKPVDDELGSRSCKNAKFFAPYGLNLKDFPYMWKDTQEQNIHMDPNWLPTKKVVRQDVRFHVNKQCDSLFDTTYCMMNY